MAKKKKPNQQPKQPLSPSKYIRLKGRSIPVVQCYINDNWEEIGIASILIIRQHQSGNYTSGQYLVDTFCMGVKKTAYFFNFTPQEMDKVIDRLSFSTEITYNEAHNIIFGALAFAEEEAEIQPHPDFKLTKYLLEEDTDDIPLIEYHFGGADGRPYLVAKNRLEASKHLPRLQKKFGNDIFFLIKEEDEFDEYERWDDDEFFDNEFFDNEFIDDEFIDEDTDQVQKKIFSNLDFDVTQDLLKNIGRLKDNFDKVAALRHTTYSYAHPEYPSVLKLTHSELEALYNMDYYYALPRQTIQQLLALPRQTLIADLNQIILCELGKTCDEITEDMYDKYANSVTHAFFLLGELKATESLQTVLEVLRQKDLCIDFYFGDSRIESLRSTLYYIASNQTDALLEFMKEPGLDCFARSYLPVAVVTMAINEPERREEAIGWFRELLHFLILNVTDSSVYDATLAGTLMSELLDIHALELLPEIKELYDTGQVDFMCCGDFQEVEKQMHANDEPLIDHSLLDIYERYQQYEKQWNH